MCNELSGHHAARAPPQLVGASSPQIFCPGEASAIELACSDIIMAATDFPICLCSASTSLYEPALQTLHSDTTGAMAAFDAAGKDLWLPELLQVLYI